MPQMEASALKVQVKAIEVYIYKNYILKMKFRYILKSLLFIYTKK